jgi:rRNA processing protein Gar1
MPDKFKWVEIGGFHRYTDSRGRVVASVFPPVHRPYVAVIERKATGKSIEFYLTLEAAKAAVERTKYD